MHHKQSIGANNRKRLPLCGRTGFLPKPEIDQKADSDCCWVFGEEEIGKTWYGREPADANSAIASTVFFDIAHKTTHATNNHRYYLPYPSRCLWPADSHQQDPLLTFCYRKAGFLSLFQLEHLHWSVAAICSQSICHVAAWHEESHDDSPNKNWTYQNAFVFMMSSCANVRKALIEYFIWVPSFRISMIGLILMLDEFRGNLEKFTEDYK